MIRPAENRDYAKIISMCRDFWLLADYAETFDGQHVLKMVRLAHDHELLVVLEIDYQLGGFVAGIAQPLLANEHICQVTELAYWIDPEHRGHGLELLSGLESAARMIGAKYLNMISMTSCNPEVADKIYQRRGYTHIETTWRKEL